MIHLGIDIGGTSIKGAAVEDGRVLKRFKTPTCAGAGLSGILGALDRCVSALLGDIPPDGKICISSAGDVDPTAGRIVYATDNLPGFTGLELKRIAEEKYSRPTVVINDAVAALAGEMTYGAARGRRCAVMLTLGTGLGGALAIDGEPYVGAHCRAGRIGHIRLVEGGRLCTCGRRGCAEQYVSATGFIKTAAELGSAARDCDGILDCAALGSAPDIRAKEVFIAQLAAVVSDLDDMLDPDVFVIGGGLIMMREKWWGDFLCALRGGIEVLPAECGNDAGALGAVAYAIGHANN